MTETETIISFLLIVDCLLLLLLYLMGITRKLRLLDSLLDEVCISQNHVLTIEETQKVILDRLKSSADRQRALKDLVILEGKKTRKESQEIKTRLSDDERDDQRRKAASRRASAKA